MKMEPNSGPVVLDTLEELRASTELSSIRLSIQRMEKQEQDSKKALADIELQLQLLRDREIGCSRKLERRRMRRLALTSCFSRLTAETLLKILLYVVSDNPTSSQRTLLRLVCKKWSRFFDTNPSLWQKLHVTIPSKLKNITGCHKYFETAMKKGGKANLDILLDYRKVPTGSELLKSALEESCDGQLDDYYGEDCNPCGLEKWAVEPYFDVISWFTGSGLENRKRWRSAEVALQHPSQFSPILSYMELLPNLTALKITAEYFDTTLGDDDEACLAKLDQTFPKLQELSVSKLDWGPSMGGIISTFLTSLSVSECSLNIFSWIPHCCSLTRLQLAHLKTFNPEFEFDSCTATLPCLKTLFLAGHLPGRFWNAFDFPLLEGMEVGSEEIEMIGLDISRIFKPVKQEIVGARWSKKFPCLRSFTVFLQAPPGDWKEHRVLDLRSSSGLGGAETIRNYLTG